MKNHISAIVLSIVLAISSVGTAPVFAAENMATETTEEAVMEEDAASGETAIEDEEETAQEMEVPAEQQDEETADVEQNAHDQEEVSDTAATEEASTTTEEVVADTEEEGASTEEMDADTDTPSNADDETPATASTENSPIEEEENDDSELELVILEEVEPLEVEKTASDSDVADTGSYGQNVTWTLTGTSDSLTLTISGTGAMDNTTAASYPWYDHRKSIKSIVIGEGITCLGDNAFQECSNLTKVSLPDSLHHINQYAFYECYGLKSITIPDNVTTIGEYAFDCCNLNKIVILENVVEIPESAFPYYNFADVYTIKGCVADNYFNCRHDEATDTMINTMHYLYEPEEITSPTIFPVCQKIVMKNGDINTIYNYVYSSGGSLSVSGFDDSILFYDSGRIVALSEGDTSITVTKGEESLTLPVSVMEEPPYATQIAFDPETLIMQYGEKRYLSISVFPEDALFEYYRLSGQNSIASNVSWSTSDPGVVTISDRGLLTATGNGTATVTITSGSLSANCEVTVTETQESIIALDEVNIERGESEKLYYTVYPIGSADSSPYEFTSDNTDIVEVSQDGMITGKAIGSANVTITKGSLSKTVKVKVQVSLKGISLDTKQVRLNQNETAQLSIIYDPEDTTSDRTARWTSSNEIVAKVDANGLVTARSKGIATITANVGGFSATCSVIVLNGTPVSMTGIELPERQTVEYGTSVKINVTYQPEDTTDDRTVTWESGDTSIFTIAEDGTLTPIGIGTATLTATVGAFTATSEITVIKGTPVYETPEAINAVCGQQLSDMSLPAGFAWDDPDQTVIGVGEQSYTASYVPEDTEHYSSVEDIAVTVNVSHVFSAEWESSLENHWHVCVCGAKDDEEPHIWNEEYTIDKQPTKTENGLKSIHCSVCDAIKEGSEQIIPTTDIVDLGNCGDDAYWTLSQTDYGLLLTISGSGDMYDYSSSNIPWASNRSRINKLVVENGITGIGVNAFSGCSGMTSASLTDSITNIRDYAFQGCSNLSEITIPSGVNSIEGSAFLRCNSLTDVKIPDSVTNIGWRAFYECGSLNRVSLYNSVTTIGDEAFGDGTVTNIRFYGTKSEWIAAAGTDRVPYNSIEYNQFSVDADFNLAKRIYNYTGKAIKPAVTGVYNGKNLVEGTDYELTYENNIEIGTATAIVTGKGEYSGVTQLDYRIRLGSTSKVTCTNGAPGMKVSWEKVSGATRYKVYRDGKYLFTTSLLAVTDKEVKYQGGKKFTYKVVAVNKTAGDSDLARTASYYRLMPVGIKSVKNTGAGKMTVTYDKSSGSSGYVVRYSLNKDMSGAKIIAVKGENTLSRTFSGLKKGKTYYVQVRTYKIERGVRYYSGYCTTKTVKIEK